jgi:sugar phosphate isomerase/epimerase
VAPDRVDARNKSAHDEVREGQDQLYAEVCDLLAGRIAMAHAKDRDAAGKVVPAGTGIIDFDAFFAALARAGFTGPIVTHGLNAADAPAVARFLRTKIAQ